HEKSQGKTPFSVGDREARSAYSSPPNSGISPFFRERHHLSAFIGSYHTNINRFDRLAFEYDIFGDFTEDIVVGDFVGKAYCFVEFEDAASNSCRMRVKHLDINIRVFPIGYPPNASPL
ncbi:MAG TPA: hypothetical protein DEP38_21515, partial [Cyanobacteria bacterium UBA9226]|nr:hypothetical protein [Cyanobacteria bacterium UBA9226]